MNLLLALALTLVVTSTSQTYFRCMSPYKFLTSYNSFENELKRVNNDYSDTAPLHSQMFLYGKKVEEEYYKEVRVLNLINSEWVMKMVEIANDSICPSMERELTALRLICGMDKTANEEGLRECNSRIVLSYKGCIQDQDSERLYVFQEKMGRDLNSQYAVDLYNKLSPIEKIDFMLQIISKFEEVHSKKIVHGDIRPESLAMNGDDFKDIRISDFRKSGNEGTKIEHESSFYTAPEHKKGGVLRFEGDIFSLAVTFAMMEKSMRDYPSSKLDSNCKEDCYQKFLMGVKQAFNKDNGTELLKNIMLKALDEDPANRYESMTDFGEAIRTVRDKLSPSNPQNQGWTWNYFKGLVGLGSGDGRRILSPATGIQGSQPKETEVVARNESVPSKLIL